MQTPRIVKAATSADLLRLVPALVGVDPRESLVLVAFTGKRTRGAMRFDLPPVDDDLDALQDWVDRAAGGFLRLQALDGVVPVAYTDATFDDCPDAPRRTLLDLVAVRCAEAGLAVKDLLVVGGDGWATVWDPDLPVAVRPLLDLVPDDASGIDDVLDAEVLTAVPDVGEAARDAFADRVEAWLRGDGHPETVHGLPVRTGFRAPGGLVDRALAGQDVTRFVEHALDEHPGAGAPCECRALLAALLCAPVLRDVVMLQAGWGIRFARHVALHSLPRDGGADVDEATVLAFGGGDFARPDGARVERAARMLVDLAGHLAPGDRAPVLTTAGWLRWTLGQGSMAGRLTDAALDADPGYGLAGIMRFRIDRGHLPEWAFRAEPGTRVGRIWAARAGSGR